MARRRNPAGTSSDAKRLSAPESSGSPLTQAGGQAHLLEALKRAEARLAEQSRLLNLTYDAVLVRDVEDRVVYWNKGAEELYGFSSKEAVGKLSHELLRTEFPEPLERIRAKLLRQGRWEGELNHARRDGRRIITFSRWALDRDSEGRPAGVLETNNDVTARRRAEEALRANLAALTRMHELSGKVLEETGLQPLLQEVMDAAVAIVGAELGTLQLLEGESLRIVAHHGHKQSFLDFFASAETRTSVCGEATKRGERVLVSDVEESPLFVGTESLGVLRAAGVRAVQSTPMMSRSGRLLGILTTQWGKPYCPDEHDSWRIDLLARQAADLIEHAKAAGALREREERLRLAAKAAKLGVFEWNVQADAAVWENDRMYEIFGLQPGFDPVNRDRFVQEVIVPEDLPRFEGELGESMGSGGLFLGSYRIKRCGDGELRWIEYFSQFELGADGKPIRLLGVLEDITERKQAEEALHRLHQRLEYHIQNTPLAVVEFDAELRVSAWSDGARRIFGWEAVEVVGRPMWEIPWICEEDRGKIEKVSDGLVSGRTLRGISPNRNVRKDGKVIWCEWYNSTLTDGTGKMQSIQSLVLDVTERKEAEAILARDKAELERLVAERTAKLQELVGELEHFSYTITHDMRAPLRAMRGFTEIVNLTCEDCERKEPKEFLRRITTSAERMDRLITDALDYSRSVRHELRLENVDTGALLRGMLDSYPELQPSRAHIRVEGELPVVLGNEAGLTQCFSNLLGNAVKFVKHGEMPEIRVWAEAGEDAEKWVRIWVEDKGIGIPGTFLPRVFDMFSRGTNKQGGTGIGLALVRKVVQRMGGRVGVESEEGVGSRFWIELRRAERPWVADMGSA